MLVLLLVLCAVNAKGAGEAVLRQADTGYSRLDPTVHIATIYFSNLTNPNQRSN